MGMKKTEVGMIPEEWNVQTFSDTFRILNNNTFSRAELNYESGQFKNIHYGDVLIRFPEVLDCTRLDVPYINDDCRISGSAQALQDGDVVIADTAEDETVGKVTEVRNTVKKPVMAGLHTIPCRVKSGEFAPMWLGYYMNSHLYHDQLLPYIHGIKVSSISKASLAETIIISPPVEEQEKIVAALSDIDALIWNTEKLIRKYQAVKQACLQRMFPQNGQNEPEMRLPGFNGAWEQRKLGEICDAFEYGLNAAAKEYDGENKYIRITDIDDSSHDFLKDDITSPDIELVNAENYRLKYGDILFARTGASVGKTYIYKESDGLVYYAGFLIRGRVKNGFSPEFIFQSTLTDDYNKFIRITSQRSGQPGVNAQEYASYEVFVPEFEEQKRIGDYFRSLDTLITLHQRKLKKYKDIKQGMMEELLTGKVRLS